MKSLEDFCRENNKEWLITEWDYETNAPLTPRDIGYGSAQRVAWKCKNGHRWEAIIANRARWSNCPYCAGKKVCKENCLATLYPSIAKEWDYGKNAPLTPEEVTAGTSKKVWWKCPKGHSYETNIHSRTYLQTQCPYCGNKKVLSGYNDLATTHPDLLKEWDYDKNSNNPTTVIAGSDSKAWWICPEGHSYEAAIGARVNGSGCPYCAGQRVSEKNCLANCDSRVAALWDYELNAPMTPKDVAVKSGKGYFWKCPNGHSWNARVSDLTAKNTGCPYCSGKRTTEKNNLLQLFPDIAAQWDYSKNNGQPSQFSAYSQKKVWWICPKGHSWEAVIGNRTTNGTGCPLCNNKSTSFPEQAILFYCKRYFSTVVSRDTDAIGRELDVFLPDKRIAIEYDGTRWHQGEDIAKKDKEKDALCRKENIKLYRVIESGVKNTHDDSVKCIYLKKNNLLSLDNAIKELFTELEVDEADVDIKRDQTQVREAYMRSVIDDSLARKNPEVSKEWDFDKNGLLSPEMFSPGSSIRVWWKCSEGHSWQATIGSRIRGGGCPYCTHKRASKEYNLGILYPDVAKEWDDDKNGALKPIDVLPQSTKKVWWICSSGHHYQMAINHRTKSGCKCPYCSGRRINDENNFAALYPNILKEWDYDRNNVSPETIGKGYTKKVWWLCPKGHSYQMTVNARTTMGQGCIYCAGKKFDESNCLATKFPELLKEWDYNKNIDIDPNIVGPGSNKKVWWICPKGHSYLGRIANRSKGSQCPYCSGKIARKILNVDTNEIYSSIVDAANKIGCSKSGILYACSSGNTVRGQHLKYIEY